MAEITIYAEQDGGGMSTAGTSFADLLTKTTTLAPQYDTAATHGVKLDATGFEIYQLLFRFDTSSLSGDTINSVTLACTRGAWGGGVSADALEAYVSDWYAGGYAGSDLMSVAEAGSLNSGGYLAATSPSVTNTDQIITVTFTSDADLPDLVDPDGYTAMYLVPSNWRTSTEATQSLNLCTQFHATEAYRPRLIIDYTAPAGFTGLTVTKILNS